MARLTKAARELLLAQNDGFTKRTYSEGKNFREERIYKVADGKLNIKASGKSSWADSHYNNEWVASDEETHRFLYRYKDEMNTDGIE